MKSPCCAAEVNQGGLHCTASVVIYSNTFGDHQQGHETFRFLTAEGRTTSERESLLLKIGFLLNSLALSLLHGNKGGLQTDITSDGAEAVATVRGAHTQAVSFRDF